ncbi:MAG: hypothetical protein HYR70_06310 [Chloroflexi bacterium]|nr:hypothetical protein [Chloroflexota bacterium]MBI3338848.1 hypothetical protein [Chloroflexota bacterium]
MSYLDFKSEEEKEKIMADQKEKTPKTIHTVVSIIYIGIILLSSPLILWSLVYGYGLLIAVVWTIASIIISRILINKNNIPVAYLVLFSTPVVTWLFMIQ